MAPEPRRPHHGRVVTVDSQRLKGRLALVTSGASGIGAATVRRLSAEGSHVVVADRDGEAAGKLAADIGGDAVVVEVADVAAVRAAVAQVEEAFGRVDVRVNNAGVTGPPCSWIRTRRRGTQRWR